jgi:hypothetical protein
MPAMDNFVKQQTTDGFLKEMFSELQEYPFSQVSLLDGADLRSINQILMSIVAQLRKLIVA